MTILPVTLALAGACALINLWLAARVVRRRLAGKILMGDGGDSLMVSRGRAHANFTEYAPIVVILVGVIELARGPSPWLWAAAAIFVAARLAHPIGMDRPAPNPFRAGGTMLTFTIMSVLAVWAIAIAAQASGEPAPGAPIEVAPASA